MRGGTQNRCGETLGEYVQSFETHVGAAISRPKRIESELFIENTQFRQLAGG